MNVYLKYRLVNTRFCNNWCTDVDIVKGIFPKMASCNDCLVVQPSVSPNICTNSKNLKQISLTFTWKLLQTWPFETRFLFLKGQRCWFWVISLFLRGKNNTICLKKLPCLHIAVQTIWVTNHSACSVANIFSLTGYEWTGRLYWRNFLFCWESFPRTLHFIGVIFKLFYFWGRGP